MTGHRYRKLPFGQPRVSLSGGALWLRSRLGVGLVRVDPESLEVVATSKIDDTSRAPWVHVVGRTLMANTGYGDVSGYDLESGERRFRRPGTLVGARGELAVVALSEGGLPVRILIDEGGAERERRGWTATEDPLAFVEDADGGEPLLLTAGEHEPRRVLRDARGVRMEAPRDAFEARRHGALVLFSLGGGELAAGDLGSGRTRGLGRAHAAALGPGGLAVARHGALTLIDAALDSRRFALPLEGLKDVAMDARRVYVVSGDLLLVVERDATQPGDQPLSVARIGAPPVRDSSPARVVFAGASTLVAVQHPRYGRLNLTRPADVTLAKGDEVILDRVVEGPAGVFKVETWHKASPSPGEAPRRADPEADDEAVLTFPLGAIAAGEPPPPTPPPRLAPSLRSLARELGLELPGTLTRVFELWDEDQDARRALERCGLILDLAPSQIEAGDPCVLPLGGNGAGDVVGLYLYPPSADAPLPVVDLWHETAELTWLAEDFDRFWETLLRKNAGVAAARTLRALCPGLGVMPAAPRPRWFEQAHGASGAAVATTDDLARERRAVRALRESGASRDVVRELAAIYERLGWTWQRRNLLEQTA